jgi:hypothetical protein
MREERAFSLLLGSGVFAQLILLVGNLALARVYSPAAFGELGYFSAFAALAVVSGLRFDYVVFTRPAAEQPAHLAISLLAAGALNLLLALALAANALLRDQSFLHAAWALLFSVSASLYYLGSQFRIAGADYHGYAAARLQQALTQVAVAFALFAAGDEGLLLAFATSQAVVGVHIVWRSRDALLSTTRPALAACWRHGRSLAVSNSFLVLLQYSTPFAPVLLGTLLFTRDDVGAFFLFSSAVSSPLAIFRRSAISLLSVEAATPARARALWGKLAPHARLVTGVGALGITASVMALAAAAPEITILVFGRAWVSHSVLLLPIVVFFVLDAIFQPLTTLLPLWGRQERALAYEVFRFLLVFGVLPATVVGWDLTFFQAICLYFVLMSLVYLMTLVSVYRQARLPVAAA